MVQTYRDGFGEKQNALFRPGPNMQLNACVGRNGGRPTFGRIASGYFTAGKMLAEGIKEQPFEIDLLIYPLLHPYRLGVEIALKHLAITFPRYFGGETQTKFTHSLLDNWQTVRGYRIAPNRLLS